MAGASDETTGRREEILTAAVVICSRQGFGGATLREIANEAGIKKGLLTYYFPTKDDLVSNVITRLHRRFETAVDDWIGASDTPDEQLIAWLRGHALLARHAADEVRVADECTRHLSPARRRDVSEQGERYVSRLGDLVDECRSTMLIAEYPAAVLARTAIGVLNRAPTPVGSETADDEAATESAARLAADRALASLLRVDR